VSQASICAIAWLWELGGPYVRVSADREELVQTRPGNRPGGSPLGKRLNVAGRDGVKLGVAPMRVRQDVGVDGDHAG
jgi:hypothetical protein